MVAQLLHTYYLAYCLSLIILLYRHTHPSSHWVVNYLWLFTVLQVKVSINLHHSQRCMSLVLTICAFIESKLIFLQTNHSTTTMSAKESSVNANINMVIGDDTFPKVFIASFRYNSIPDVLTTLGASYQTPHATTIPWNDEAPITRPHSPRNRFRRLC